MIARIREEPLARHLTIVEVAALASDNLLCVSSLAGNEDTVACFRLRQGPTDRFGPIRNHLGLGGPLEAAQNIFEDDLRVFAARIVVGHDDQIGVAFNGSP